MPGSHGKGSLHSRLPESPSEQWVLEILSFLKKFRSLAAMAAVCFALTGALPGSPQNQQPQRPTSTPYSGDLSIFETPGRDERLQIQRVMDLLGIKQGSGVADLGAGSGWFTVRASARVGPAGTVYAEDINPEAIQYINQRLRKERITNVHTIQGTPDDPKLSPHSVDAVLMLKVYHEIAHPLVLLGNLKPALKPDAKVGIIDRSGNGSDHGLNSDVVKREMQEAGFSLVASYDFTKADGQDYFLVFEAK
jgi:SAM-dependent methyltransferase